MKRKQFLRAVGRAASVALLLPGLTAFAAGKNAVGAVVYTLSPQEVAGLTFMREEEKLAHDVYSALFGLWGAQVFSQIALSETTHTEAILALLVKYGLPDPAAGKAPGEFEDPALQSLYNTLIALGKTSLIAALKVGALIEETDIRDIHEKQAATDAIDILNVYSSLLCGSRNHLRAFNGQLLAQGVTYVPQVITQTEWDAIASAAPETCGK
jgi:hypothetical protein